MTVIGPDFISLQVRDLAASAAFYETHLGLRRAAVSPPHAVVFDTTPASFAVREMVPGVALDSAPQPGIGVGLWMHAPDAQDIHDALVEARSPIVLAPLDGPFGRTFGFTDPDGYTITLHSRA